MSLLVAHSLQSTDVGSRVRIRSGKHDSALAEFTAVGRTLGFTAPNLGDLDGDGVPETVLGEHEDGNCQGRARVISLGASIPKRQSASLPFAVLAREDRARCFSSDFSTAWGSKLAPPSRHRCP